MCRLDQVEHKVSFFCALLSMGILHDIRLGRFLKLPETCGRHLSDFGLVGSAVPFSGANKAIDKTGMVLSLSVFILFYFFFLLLTAL